MPPWTPPLLIEANYVGIRRIQYQTLIYLATIGDIGIILDKMYIRTYQDKTSGLWGCAPVPPKSVSLQERSSSQLLSRSDTRAKKSARHRTDEDETGEKARWPQGSSRGVSVDFCYRVTFFLSFRYALAMHVLCTCQFQSFLRFVFLSVCAQSNSFVNKCALAIALRFRSWHAVRVLCACQANQKQNPEHFTDN